MVHEIRFSIRFDTGAARVLLATAVMLVPLGLGSENLTLVTSYPAPSGVYNQIVTVGRGNANTILVRDGGSVGIGTTNPGAQLHVMGTAGNSTGVWGNLSDERLKKNIRPLSSALNTVVRLNGVKFEWRKPMKGLEGEHMGLLAQQVEGVIPAWVKTDTEGYRWLHKEGVEALLIEAIKELKVENEDLRRRFLKLQAKITRLDSVGGS